MISLLHCILSGALNACLNAATTYQQMISLRQEMRLELQRRIEDNDQPKDGEPVGIKQKHHDPRMAHRGLEKDHENYIVAPESGAKALNFDHTSQVG